MAPQPSLRRDNAINLLLLLATPARLELATLGLGNRCSIQLSYGAMPTEHAD